MRQADQLASRSQGLLCVLVLLAAVVMSHPVAETGICDDWSYVRTAEVLARTGHIVYNGWATAMLGWQLIPAALFVRLFGASFLVVRASTVVVALLTTYGLQRCMIRCGINAWNAVVATLVIALSPLFMPLATTYMSDMFGLFPVVLSLYCCVRAVQANEAQASGWIALAAICGVIGGTARQISWLALLVMVPSTGWLLRAQRRTVVTAVVCWVLGCGCIAACMRWFHDQPYAVPETFAHARFTGESAVMGIANFLRLGLDIGVLLLPLLLGFLPILLKSRKRLLVMLLGLICVGGFALLAHRRIHNLGQFLVPTLLDGGNLFGVEGMITAGPEHGLRPRLLSDPFRLLLTLLVVAGCAAVVVGWLSKSDDAVPASSPKQLGWRALLTITVPFMLSYLLLLVPRAALFLEGATSADTPPSHPYDRYGLPLLVPAALLLTRFYQDRVRGRLPLLTVAWMGVVAAYSVATTHDAFAMYRGTKAAVVELAEAGIPPTALDAGWEYSGWTQITEAHFVHDPRLHLEGEPATAGRVDTRPCVFGMQYLFPTVRPVYSLALEPAMCGGSTAYSPVLFHTWLPWRTQRIYVVRNAP